jgi:hypothetical protein
MRMSAHYNDSGYDFEGWIRDVLPNIGPEYGGKADLGVHMWIRRAVWTEIIHTPREWLMEIPDELAQYLGDYECKPRWNPRTISLLAPSRWRPDQCIRNLRDHWLLRAQDLQDIELIIAVDTDDETVSRYALLAGNAFQNLLSYKLITGQHKSMTHALETAAKASTGDILITLFDDFEAPADWDVCVKKRLRDQEGKCLFVYDDMHDVSVGVQTMSIMTRRCYRDWGYCWYPEYCGMYGDQDYTQHCLLENRAVWALDLIFVHQHYMKTGAPPDRTYIHGNAREKTDIGRRVLAERQARNFQF